jgi:hypothetical protein
VLIQAILGRDAIVLEFLGGRAGKQRRSPSHMRPLLSLCRDNFTSASNCSVSPSPLTPLPRRGEGDLISVAGPGGT